MAWTGQAMTCCESVGVLSTLLAGTCRDGVCWGCAGAVLWCLLATVALKRLSLCVPACVVVSASPCCQPIFHCCICSRGPACQSGASYVCVCIMRVCVCF